MKKIFIFLTLPAIAISCGRTFSIDVFLEADAPYLMHGTAYLSSSRMKEVYRDTAEIVNGYFHFEGRDIRPGHYVITLDGYVGNARFFMENDNYQLRGKGLKDCKVTGGETQTLYNLLEERKNSLLTDDQYSQLLMETMKNGTSEARKMEIKSMIDSLTAELNAYSESLISSHPKSYFALEYVYDNMARFDLEKLECLSGPLLRASKFKEDEHAAVVRQYVLNERELQLGGKCAEINLPQRNGQMVSLSSVYSEARLTMICFVNSQSGKAFKAEISKVYDLWHDKGFNIYAVSLDASIRAWGSKSPLWPEVSDLKSWQGEAAVRYNIRTLPQNLFVDPRGIIVGRNVATADIEDFVKNRL